MIAHVAWIRAPDDADGDWLDPTRMTKVAPAPPARALASCARPLKHCAQLFACYARQNSAPLVSPVRACTSSVADVRVAFIRAANELADATYAHTPRLT